MSETLGIPPEIMRLTATSLYRQRLEHPMGSAEMRSPICGSRVLVDVNMDEQGRINAVGLKVNACAFSQAATSVMAAHLLGRTCAEVADVRDALASWIGGTGDTPNWPEIEHLRPERLNAVRKASVQLAFRAAAEAAERAVEALQSSGVRR